jgi:NADH:ubiquinone oxidoreductase subunit K
MIPTWIVFNRRILIDLMKVEILLLEENYDLIQKSNYFEQLELDSD